MLHFQGFLFKPFFLCVCVLNGKSLFEWGTWWWAVAIFCLFNCTALHKMHVKIDCSKHLSVSCNLHFLSWLFIFCRSSFYSGQTWFNPWWSTGQNYSHKHCSVYSITCKHIFVAYSGQIHPPCCCLILLRVSEEVAAGGEEVLGLCNGGAACVLLSVCEPCVWAGLEKL